jgi:hypothetical protein
MIRAPGARRETSGELFENNDTSSRIAPSDPSPVDPTLTAVEMHAGTEMPDALPWFPEAITVAMPAERRLSIKGFIGLLSQAPCWSAPPRLILTAAKP